MGLAKLARARSVTSREGLPSCGTPGDTVADVVFDKDVHAVAKSARELKKPKEASPVSLASSKTAEPRLSAVLPRRRLFGAIDKARRCPLVWVTGPAGSGKTTLVSSYLKARRVPAVWYRIDPLDGDLGRLFHHLSNGLARARRRRRIELRKTRRARWRPSSRG